MYDVVLGRLCRRCTRIVRFETTDEKLVKVFIDGNDYTGRMRTFAHSSTHNVRAKVAKVASNEWNVR